MRESDLWPGRKEVEEMSASQLMKRRVVSYDSETTCHILAEAMVERNFGSAPIVDQENRLLGIVSECDLLNALMRGVNFCETFVSDVMTEVVVSIPEEMSAEEVCALLQARHLIRVPVVNKKGRLVGIVSRRDILGGYIESNLAARQA